MLGCLLLDPKLIVQFTFKYIKKIKSNLSIHFVKSLQFYDWLRFFCSPTLKMLKSPCRLPLILDAIACLISSFVKLLALELPLCCQCHDLGICIHDNKLFQEWSTNNNNCRIITCYMLLDVTVLYFHVAFAGAVEMRWVDTYFPFTSPSFELEIFFQVL